MAGRSLCFIAFSLFLMLVGTTEIKAEWPENGTPVCTDSLVQRYPQITTDGAGGAIITWIDFRCGHPNADVYAQRIAANGDPL
ncbi:MAG: hypothetical protein NTW97_00555, partial [Candidatus Krumholzibacteria bacterium]|nr:hypothetical protein [Candidatus Krumholzibacteria bacterium]